MKEGVLGRESALSLNSLTCLALSHSSLILIEASIFYETLGKSGVVTLDALIYGPALELRNKVTPPVPTFAKRVCPGPQLRVRLS